MSRGLHGTVTMVLSSVVALLGVALIATAIAGGGGPASRGVLIGALFVLAGGGRAWIAWRAGLPTEEDADDG